MFYFDHASGVIPGNQELDDLRDLLLQYSANQEAVHFEAYRARRALEAAKQRLLFLLTDDPQNYSVIPCDSGSTAISLLGNWGRLDGRVLTSKMEHPAVYAALKKSSVTKCANDSSGRITLPENCGEFNAVFFHHIQSETGVIQNLEELFSEFPSAVKIADTIQSAGKFSLPRNADIMTVSGAKAGVPGAAALIVKKCYASEIEALAKACRDNYTAPRLIIPFFIAMVNALERRVNAMAEHRRYVLLLQKQLRAGLAELPVDITIAEEFSTPYICHLNFPGKEGAVIVRMLSEDGVSVGSGSACSAESGEPSAALAALGFKKRGAFSGLRVSFDISNTAKEVDFLLEVLKKALKNY